jgi:ABC-type nitrate/sulfonate/bicarbonate transport system substrate-binding protein
VADRPGYFAEQGIRLKIVPYASTAPETLVAQGTADYGFPDQYATLLASSQKYLKANGEEVRKFLAALQKGYAYAADHPKEAAEILIDANKSAFPDTEPVYRSQQLEDARAAVGCAAGGAAPPLR